MKQIFGKPYFCDVEEKIKQYPYLCKNISCEILIVGGGIDGATANYFLSQKYNCILVDSKRLGQGCTSCATALLEYQLDDFAEDLQSEMTEEEIVEAYKLGMNSAHQISEFIKKHGNNCDFRFASSLLYSDSSKDYSAIKKEYEFRKKNNFKAEFFEEENNPFPFKLKAGLFCEDGGAEFNPYLFTKQAIEHASNQNNIFENTKIKTVEQKEGYIESTTEFGDKIRSSKILFATGFDNSLFSDKEICERFFTFSIVTKPIEGINWHNRALIQDCKSKYHYLRLLPDNRIIFGGEDRKYKNKTLSEKKAKKVYQKLEESLKEILTGYAEKIETEYAFCGLFGTTLNNLGIIGQGHNPNFLFFLSCGANGIINAFIGIDILKDILAGKENKAQKLFCPTRMENLKV